MGRQSGYERVNQNLSQSYEKLSQLGISLCEIVGVSTDTYEKNAVIGTGGNLFHTVSSDGMWLIASTDRQALWRWICAVDRIG